MKITRRKIFNYDAAATSPEVFDYYVDSSQALSVEEMKHSSPETKVPTYGNGLDGSTFRVAFVNAKTDRQESVRVDFYASGFNYDKAEIVDPSAYHTWFKVYHNPKDISIHVYESSAEGREIFSGKEYVIQDTNDVPTYLTFEFGGDAHFFDASIEYLSGNNSGYWIGPMGINMVEGNTDYWSPSDRNVAVPVIGTEMKWANTTDFTENYKLYDENGELVTTVPELYNVPKKLHLMIYPRDFTGISVRKARVNFEFYSLYSDDYIAHVDPSIAQEKKLKKNKKSFWILLTQPGKPIVLDVVGDSKFPKNDMSYLTNETGDTYNLIGTTLEINSIYPSLRENKTDYKYIGLKTDTNAPIMSIKIFNESREEMNPNVAAVFNTDTNAIFTSFTPSKTDVTCNFYIRIKKYQITNAEANNGILNRPLKYFVVLTLDNGNDTPYEIQIDQYGYIHSESMKTFDYYPYPSNETEDEHSEPSKKVATLASDSSGIVYPIFWTNQ